MKIFKRVLVMGCKLRNKQSYLSIIILSAFLLSSIFSGCSKDETDDKGPIDGSWKLVKKQVFYPDSTQYSYIPDKETIYVISNPKITRYERATDVTPFSYCPTQVEDIRDYTGTSQGDVMYVRPYGCTDTACERVFTFNFENEYLIIEEEINQTGYEYTVAYVLLQLNSFNINAETITENCDGSGGEEIPTGTGTASMTKPGPTVLDWTQATGFFGESSFYSSWYEAVGSYTNLLLITVSSDIVVDQVYDETSATTMYQVAYYESEEVMYMVNSAHTFSFKITEWGGDGGNAAGEFSGTLFNPSDSSTLEITNGYFSNTTITIIDYNF